MKPGRELDAVVAEKVMGWTQCDSTVRWPKWEHGDPGDDWTEVDQEWCRGDGAPPENRYIKKPIPRYSTSIADAWLVVEELGNDGNYPFILTVDRYGGTYCNGPWLASFGVFMDEYQGGPLGDDVDAAYYWRNAHAIASGETASHAICLAALKAGGYELVES